MIFWDHQSDTPFVRVPKKTNKKSDIKGYLLYPHPGPPFSEILYKLNTIFGDHESDTPFVRVPKKLIKSRIPNVIYCIRMFFWDHESDTLFVRVPKN